MLTLESGQPCLSVIMLGLLALGENVFAMTAQHLDSGPRPFDTYYNRIGQARRWWPLWLLAGSAILLRGLLVSRWPGDFESDEAIVGLMAKHILEGNLPVFFYGQFYMGSLEALVAAAYFWLLNDINGLILRFSPITFYLAFLVVSYLWLETWHNRPTAIWGTLFLAIPPAAPTKWTYVARGGFPEILFLGTLLFLLFQRSLTTGWTHFRLFGVGFVAGLALWTNPLAVLYLATTALIWILGSKWWQTWRIRFLSLPLLTWIVIGLALLLAVMFAQSMLQLTVDAIYIQRLLVGSVLVAWVASLTVLRWAGQLQLISVAPHQHPETKALWLGLGVVLGMAPMIYFFFNPGTATGGRDSFNFPIWSQIPALLRLLFSEIFPALIGLRGHPIGSMPGWTLFLKMIAAATFAVVVLFFCSRYRQALLDVLLLRSITPRSEHYLLVLGGLTIGFGLINGNIADFEHMRYFVPLIFVIGAVIGIAFAHLHQYRPVAALMLAVLLWGYYGLTQWYYYKSLPNGLPEQQVVEYLLRHDIKGGYAYTRHAYNITFLSQEQVIASPYASRNRYEPYSHYVESLPKRVYILPEGAQTEFALPELGSLEGFSKETISGFDIFIEID
jgi:hypothetical protein